MLSLKEYIRRKKLEKEIRKHDKSYIKDKFIVAIDENTGISIYSFPKNKDR